MLFFTLASASGAATLTVAAAADLSKLEPELAQAFEKTNPIRVRFVTEASGMLAQQIESGAPYDIFMSANAQFVERLASLRKMRPDSVETYATGQLAVLWRDGKRHSLNDLKQNWVRIVAIANPKLAPYGFAAQQTLEHAGIWTALHGKVVYGENVRQTLQLFDSGNADAVLTAASLVMDREPEIVPAAWHQPIVQKAGLVSETQNQRAAEMFLRFLLSPTAQAIFAKYGLGAPKP